MPSLTSDNNVNVLISTKADLEGVDKTKAGMSWCGQPGRRVGRQGIAWGSNIKSAGLIAGVALAGVVKVGGDLVSSFNDSAQYGAAAGRRPAVHGGAAGITKTLRSI
jgi:hypothetical protein